MDDLAVMHYLRQINIFLEQMCKEHIADNGLTTSQSFCIAYLLRHNADEEGICPTELCRASGVSRPAISALLKELKKKGYLEMAADPGDDRKKHIVLTEKAREYEQKMQEDMNRTRDCLCKDIPEEDVRITERCLGIMLKNLKQETKRRNDL